VVQVARQVKADAVCHGSTGKGNDQVRFELGFFSLAPDLTIISPWRTWSFKGREDLLVYAAQHGIPVPVSKKKPYSRLMGTPQRMSLFGLGISRSEEFTNGVV
jgi:argininosuccinate synthase